MTSNKTTEAIPGYPGLYRKLSTGIIYGPVVIDGVRRRISSGEKDPQKALTALHRSKLKLNKREEKKTHRKSFDEEWEQWLIVKDPTWKKGTTIDVKTKGKHLLSFFNGHMVDEINEVEWEKYIGFMAPKNQRLAKHQDYLTSFLRYEHQRGVIDRVPNLRNPDPKSDVGTYFSESDIQKLLAKANPDLKLFILMAVRMGMRSGEILLLAKDRIDLEGGFVTLKSADTKTRYGRLIPIHSQVKALLEQKMGEDSPFLFPSPNGPNKSVDAKANSPTWRRLLKRCGLSGRRHDLRHTCATNMARANVNPVVACRILGMSLEVYDRVYCKPQPDDLKKAIEQVGAK